MIRVVGGSLRGRRLATPRSAAVRPTSSRVREAVFDILQRDVPDARVLDLFAGSGAMGIEALSRGASHATFVEHSPEALVAIRRNVEELGLQTRVRVMAGAAASAIDRLAGERRAFDLAFADPPYADDPSELLGRLTRGGLLAGGGALVLEVAFRRRLPIPEGFEGDRRRYGDTELLVLRSGPPPACL